MKPKVSRTLLSAKLLTEVYKKIELMAKIGKTSKTRIIEILVLNSGNPLDVKKYRVKKANAYFQRELREYEEMVIKFEKKKIKNSQKVIH